MFNILLNFYALAPSDYNKWDTPVKVQNGSDNKHDYKESEETQQKRKVDR